MKRKLFLDENKDFIFTGSAFVLLHGFVKKTNKTPVREIDRARKYKEDYERRCNDE
jgi:phage-related protein